MIGQLKKAKTVKIIGGGFSGLCAAFELQKNGIDYQLYEQSDWGGKIFPKQTYWGPCEFAASSFYLSQGSLQFLQDLKLEPLLATQGLKKKIFLNQKWQSPMSYSLLARLPLSVFRPVVKRQYQLDQFLKPLVGERKVRELISTITQGIYGVGADQLDIRNLFEHEVNSSVIYAQFLFKLRAALKREKTDHPIAIANFEGGMGQVIERLRSSLTNLQNEKTSLSDNTLVASSALEAAQLVQDDFPQLAQQLRRISYIPMTSFVLYSDQPLGELSGCFGGLIASTKNLSIMGVIHQSEVFPKNFKSHCYLFRCSGEMSEGQLLKQMKKLFPHWNESSLLDLQRCYWHEALPVYNTEHYLALVEMKKILSREQGIAFLGNYTGGISLRSIVSQSQQLLYLKQ